MKRILFTLFISAAMISSSCRRGLDYEDVGEPLVLSATNTDYSDSSMVASRAGGLEVDTSTNAQSAQAAHLEQLGEMQALWGSTTRGASKSASRATEAGFQSGDQIGVYIHTTTSVDISNTHTANMRYSTTDKGVTWRTSNALTGALTASSYYVTSYYPHQASLVDPRSVPHVVLADQSAAEGSVEGNLEKSDFMSNAGVAVTDPKGLPKASLVFAHRMSKFRINLIVPSTIDGLAVTGVKSASIKALRNTSTINLATGVVSVTGSAVAIKPRLISGTGAVGTTNRYEAVVVPQNVTGASLVEFICTTASGDRPLSYVVPATGTVSFRSGERLTLTLVSSADVAFLGELDLLDGLAKTAQPLTIKAPLGEAWTLTSPASWLTVSATASGVYGATVSGTGTGDVQTVYVKVVANDKAVADVWAPREALLSLKSGAAATAKTTTYLAVQGYNRFEISTQLAVTLISDTPVMLPEVASNQAWKLKGTIPSWLKITTAPVKWAAANSGNTITIPAAGYEVVGSTTLYAVADPATLSRLGGTLANGTTAATVKLTYDETDVNIYWTHSFGHNGTVWSSGNLVSANETAANTAAQGGARIGAMYDGGLYFRFGSLVGLKGGATGSGVGTAVDTHDTGYWLRPTGHTASTEWSNSAYFNDASKTKGDLRDYVTKDNDANGGVGDACRYYLGSPWRLPTGAEYGGLLNNQYAIALNVNWGGSGGRETTTPTTTLYGGWWNGTPSSTIALPTATYFVGSGYRHYVAGALTGIGTEGGCWSSSINNAFNGLALSFLSGYVRSQYNFHRLHGFPLRCVQGINIALETGTHSPVASSAHKVTLRVAGTDGDSWTLAESGAGAASFTPNITSGKFGTNNTIEIAVAANTTAALRTVSYTLTSGERTSTVTIEQAPAYVQIGSLKWATGNLVATNTTAPNTAGAGGARIGAPYDGGLYFKFGSLVGLKGGFDGSGVGQSSATLDKGYWLRPTGNTNTDWTSAEYFKGTQTSGEFNALVADNATNGVGDACRYYLGAPWRMPTTAEFVALCNNKGGLTVNVGWSATGGKETRPTTSPATTLYGGWWSGTSNTAPVFGSAAYFVGSGWRHPTDGSLNLVGSYGVYWSSSISSDTYGLYLDFNTGGAYPQYSSNRTHGFPLRCVQQGINITMEAGTHSPVASSAHKATLRVHGVDGDSWTLAESGAGAASFTPNITSGKFGTNNTIEITVAANAAAAMRTVTYTLTSGGLTSALIIEQAPAYVQIGSLKWATGNLVATNATAANTAGVGGARVGAPYDGGLYFKFGSLVGLQGGLDGSGVGTAVITHGKNYWLRPTGHTTSTDWASAAYFDDATKTTGDFKDHHPTDNDANDGIGDACRFYLGSPWRLPTGIEYGDLANKQYAVANVGWAVTGGKETSPTTNPATPLYGGWLNGTSSSTTDLLTAAYFVGSGYRNSTDGSFGAVNSRSIYWSSFVNGSSGGIIRDSYAGNMWPNNHSNRNFGLPLRCVQGVRIDLAVGTYNPVASSAHKVNMSVSGGAAGENWTLAESGAGAASFTPNITSGKFGTNNTIELTVAANTTAAMRTVSYTLTSGGMTSAVTIEQAPAYVQIGTLKWATGNLVSVNTTAPNTSGAGGARVGSPYDGGLYFKFGSLVGLKGGANGSGVGTAVNTHDTGYWLRPTGHTTSTDWTSAAYFDDATKTTGDFKDHHPTDNAANDGIGDACRFYLGSPWRMPTTAEFVALCNNQGAVGENVGWLKTGGKETSVATDPATPLYGGWWNGTSSTTTDLLTAVYFVAPGYSHSSDGTLNDVGSRCGYWSSSICNAASGLHLESRTVYVYSQGTFTRVNGFPLRCVQ